jgi:Na+/H+-dicarboxylate symporter/ABC-type amino acid transport substrate-binding protein
MTQDNEKEDQAVDEVEEAPRPKRKMSLAARTMIALVCGLFLGLFVGEHAAILEPVGRAFTLLLKMPLIPYVVVSLLWGVGRLTPALLKNLGLKGLRAFALLWALMMAAIVVLSVSFPITAGEDFFTDPNASKEGPSADIVSLLIPSNPFNALAEGVVPGVVVFCLCLAYFITQLPNKDDLLTSLDVVYRALEKMLAGVAQLVPYGVFSLIAVAAGTMQQDEFERLKIYLLTVAIGSTFLTFLVPALLAATTGLSYSEIMKTSASALAIAFTTGSLFVALPYLVEACKTLVRTNMEGEEAEGLVDTFIPIAFIAPGGAMMRLLFIPYIAASFGVKLGFVGVASYLFLGMICLFSGDIYTITFLLDYLKLPDDSIFLYIQTEKAMAPFLTALGLISLVAVTVWTVWSMRGRFKMTKRAYGLLAVSLFCLFGIAQGLKTTPPPSEGKKYYFAHQTLQSEARIVESPTPNLEPALARVQNGGILRVGFLPERFPFSYKNAEGALVGYHVSIAQQLAYDIGCPLAMVPTSLATMNEDLREGRIDTIAGPISITASRLKGLGFSNHYLRTDIVMVAPDYMRELYSKDPIAVKTVAVLKSTRLKEVMDRNFSERQVVVYEEPDELLDAPPGTALVWDRVEAVGWCQVHPGYSIVPLANEFKLIMAFPARIEDRAFLTYLNAWLAFRTADGFLKRHHKRWILAEDGKSRPARWSIMRDVLHWR